MRQKTLISICFIGMAVFFVLGSCATMKSPDKMTYERFCGTWVNKDYEPTAGLKTGGGAKFIFNPDGTFVNYNFLNQAGPAAVGTFAVEKRWTDPSGSSFYNLKIYYYENDSTWYCLCQLNNQNAVFEISWSNTRSYPEAIDPKDWHSSYSIYYRY
jgi:hypothetical protein